MRVTVVLFDRTAVEFTFVYWFRRVVRNDYARVLE